MTVWETSPVAHSALMSVYTCTLCDAPSVDTAVIDVYAKGIDCRKRSLGYERSGISLVRTRGSTHRHGRQERVDNSDRARCERELAGRRSELCTR